MSAARGMSFMSKIVSSLSNRGDSGDRLPAAASDIRRPDQDPNTRLNWVEKVIADLEPDSARTLKDAKNIDFMLFSPMPKRDDAEAASPSPLPDSGTFILETNSECWF